MWVIIFMVSVVVPFIIWGCILSWRERQSDREHDKAVLRHTDTASLS